MMDAQEILKEIAILKPKSIYGMAAKQFVNDKMKSAEFVAELYDDIKSDIHSFTENYGFEVTQSIVRLVHLN